MRISLTRTDKQERGRIRRLAALFLAVSGISFAGVQSTQDAIAQGGTRTLTIFHAHTKEQETITFKRFGSYDAAGLKQLNWILRDWRKDEPTRMDPALFDILWETYQASGSSAPIHVVSAYRSPGTNAMLARRSRGVAKNSQHMSGRAMDFNLPDVSMSKVRDIGLRLQNGGVGYYPRANNPWVHLDTGGVRHWPKVSRDHLMRLFPDEKTVHIPSDGRPLAGFEAARSIIEARGGAVSSGYLDIASGKATGKTLFQILFGGGEGDDEDVAPVRGGKGRTAVASRQRGNQRVASAPLEAGPDSDGGSAIAFFNQNNNSTTVASRVETPAAQAAIRPRPSRPTPIVEPKAQEEKPAEAPVKAETPVKIETPVKADTPAKIEAPAKPETPQKEDATKIVVASLGQDAKAGAGRWVNIALPQRRPANLAPSGPPLVTVTLPMRRPADLDSAAIGADESASKTAETPKPVQVASAGRSVSIPLPVARPVGLAPEAVGLRTASPSQPASVQPAPAPVVATAAPATALGYAPQQAIPRIIPASPAAAAPVKQAVSVTASAPEKTKDKKSLDALISQVSIASSPTRGGPVAEPSVASVASRNVMPGKFEARENQKAEGQKPDSKGFSGSAIRPLGSGFRTTE